MVLQYDYGCLILLCAGHSGAGKRFYVWIEK